MNKNTRLLVCVFSVLILVAILATGTYAFLTSRDSIVNKMKIADCTAKIVEEFDGKEKSVVITNTGNTALLVRANAHMICTNGEVVLDAKKVAEAQYNNLTTSYPEDKWVDGGDGWYYYANLLQPKETTSELVHIKIKDTFALTNQEKILYDNANLDVPVQLEFHYPHNIDGKYVYEESWNITNSNIKDMLKTFTDYI